jgi:hypothetical protein
VSDRWQTCSAHHLFHLYRFVSCDFDQVRGQPHALTQICGLRAEDDTYEIVKHLRNTIPSPISMLCQSCADFLPRTLVEECSFDHQIEVLFSCFSTTCHLCRFLQDKFLPIETEEFTGDAIPSVKLLWMRNGASYKVVQARGQRPWHPPVDLRLVTAERARYHRQKSSFLLTFGRTRTIHK